MRKPSLLLLITSMLLMFGCSNENSTSKKYECNHLFVDTFVEETCSKGSYIEHKCKLCRYTYISDEKEAPGHDFSVDNSLQYFCSRCGCSEVDGFEFEPGKIGNKIYRAIKKSDYSKVNVVNGCVHIPRKYDGFEVIYMRASCLEGLVKNDYLNHVTCIKIPSTIKYMEGRLFRDAYLYDESNYSTSLKEILFDSECNNITIDANAFKWGDKIENVVLDYGTITTSPIPSTALALGPDEEYIGSWQYLFKGCPFFDNNYVEYDGVRYIKNLALDINRECFNNNEMPDNVICDVRIKEGTTYLNAYLFSNCKLLKNVYLPKSIKMLDKYLFFHCYSLENVFYNGTLNDFKNVYLGTSLFGNDQYDCPINVIHCTDGDFTVKWK